MKKLISLVLCAAVCLTAGCKSKNETPAVSLPGGTSSVSTPANVTSDASSSSGENGGFVRCKRNGSVYTSDFFGFSIDLDSSWTILSDEQTAKMNGIADMSDEVFLGAVERSNKNSGVYEVMASRSDTSESFALAYSKCGGMTLEDYIDSQVKGLSSDYKDVRTDKIDIAGKSVDCIYATLSGEDIEVKEAFLPYKNGDYIALIVIAAYSDSGLKSILSSTLGASVGNIPDVSEPSVENGGFVRGKWNDNVFTSDFFGIKVTLDDSCVKETDTQLAARNGIADMSDANFNSAVEKSNQNTAIYEIFLRYGQTGSFALAYNRFNGVSLDNYVQANANGLKLSTSFKDIKVDKVNIAGKDQPCVYTTFTSGIAQIKEAMVMYKNGDYFAIATISAASDDELQNMIQTLFG